MFFMCLKVLEEGVTNRGCLHCSTLKILHGFQNKRAQKSRDMQLLCQNVQNEVFEIFQMFKKQYDVTK